MSDNTNKNSNSANATDRITNELTAFFANLAERSQNIKILAAVSGGADSVALVHLLTKNRENFNIKKIAVAHVNHGLRGAESDGDEEFVRRVAKNLNAEIYCTRLDGVCADDSGIENLAREARYNFFAKTMTAHGFDYVATAHTANDQAETVIMRLARGTGLRGLRGIHPVRADGVIRPLLNVTREEIEKYLAAENLPYREDSSNESDNFRRNYVRHHVIPKLLKINANAVENIAASASEAMRVWDHISVVTNEWIKNFVLRINDGAFHIEKIGFAENENIAADALAVLFDEYGIGAARLHIGRVVDVLSKTSGIYLLPNGWRLYPRDDRLCFVRGD